MLEENRQFLLSLRDFCQSLPEQSEFSRAHLVHISCGAPLKQSSSTQMWLKSSAGHQGQECWSLLQNCWQINAHKLVVHWLFLRKHPLVFYTSICFQMDNQVSISCINYRGSSSSCGLLHLSERLFFLALQQDIRVGHLHTRGGQHMGKHSGYHRHWSDSCIRQVKTEGVRHPEVGGCHM